MATSTTRRPFRHAFGNMTPARAYRPRPPHRSRQRGAFAPMLVILLVVILGFCGLALDIGLIYNRKAELQSIAQSAAVSAARELNGTSAGISAALAKAAHTASRLRFAYKQSISWTDAAVTFSASPAAGAEWVGADNARATPANKFYVKVDTHALEQDIGLVETIFMPLLAGAHATASIGDRAVAGRSTIHVMPLAVCALSATPAAPRSNPGPPEKLELVEYGFRRGITYDLMQLNPDATTPAHFAIDPLAPPGGLGSASNTSASALSPFVCTGRMWIARLTGGMIRVRNGFPLDGLHRQLNSRFDQYSGGVCNANGAPPDYNVKAYTPSPDAGASWIDPRPAEQGAHPVNDGNRRVTLADLAHPPADTAPGSYGPLWAYAKAAKFSAYVPGQPEPRAGYATFSTAEWPVLYPAAPAVAATGYPSSTTPYQTTRGNYYQEPSSVPIRMAVRERRVLHIPLLACPVPPGTNVGASARAIARFFMTAPATPTSLHAEFAGIVPEEKLAGQITVYP